MTNALEDKVKELQHKYNEVPAKVLVEKLWFEEFPQQICVTSSFGAEAAVILHFVSEIDKNFPVIFIDTQKLFSETLEYRDKLIEQLSLNNVKTIYPDYSDIVRDDSDGSLWTKNPRMCCYIRKVRPLERALKGYKAWITGRKRYHGDVRSELPFIETLDGRIKINPLANWTEKEIHTYFESNNLPRHALAIQGYTSIGCEPCTSIPGEGEGTRSGRWKGSDQKECGIHIGKDGRFYPTNRK